jgi:alpha-glucuronidase
MRNIRNPQQYEHCRDWRPSASGFCRYRTFAPVLLILFFWAALLPSISRAEDGYRLWLRYDRIDDQQLLQQYRAAIHDLHFNTTSATLRAASDELTNGLEGLLGHPIGQINGETAHINDGTLLVGTPASSAPITRLHWTDSLTHLGQEGFLIRH